MDRRRFLASAAATAIAPSCLAQPATDFIDLSASTWTARPMVYGPGIWSAIEPYSEYWSVALRQYLDSIKQEVFHITAIPAHMQGPRP